MTPPPTLADLLPDERKLIEVVRSIKSRVGFGEFTGVITAREIITIKEGYTHKLKQN